LTKEKEEQWELSDEIVDNDELSNTDHKSKEHDLDKINIYTMSKGKDEDNNYGEKYIHLGKKFNMKGVEESLPLDVRIWMRRSVQEEPLQKIHYSCVFMLLRL
jgi:hypothetical protein